MNRASERVENDEDLTEMLRALRVDPELDAGTEPSAFEAALHRRLAAAGPPKPVGLVERLQEALGNHPLWAGGAAGVVAGAAAFTLLVALHGADQVPRQSAVTVADVEQTAGALAGAEAGAAPRTKPEPPSGLPTDADEAPVFQVPRAKVAVVKLHFTAEVAVEDVDFTIVLTEGLSFWSEGEALAQRSFRWRARLNAGDNPVPIAVRGERPGRYRIMATAAVGEEVVMHEVILHVKEAA